MNNATDTNGSPSTNQASRYRDSNPAQSLTSTTVYSYKMPHNLKGLPHGHTLLLNYHTHPTVNFFQWPHQKHCLSKTDNGKEAMDPSPNRLPQSVCSVTAVAFSEVLTPLGVLYVAVELICTSTKLPKLQPNSPYQIAGAVIAGDTNGCPVFHYQPSNVFVTHLCGSALLTSPTKVSAVGKIASIRSNYVVSPLTQGNDCNSNS
ncbi:hypothetical protein PCANC_03781 [Puccinia coronata f. sp. avenae]|uniref:Uncharacterized protein n=1 Tax=Puccinia coronata f. sp. avenae TaxID=200324 RepID=A0A2N5VV74_9BASI|nr:hypothetical protein PCANC_03781 [Puccinia coronata f. sp. avenae]